jgi:hypothetical protein
VTDQILRAKRPVPIVFPEVFLAELWTGLRKVILLKTLEWIEGHSCGKLMVVSVWSILIVKVKIVCLLQNVRLLIGTK